MPNDTGPTSTGGICGGHTSEGCVVSDYEIWHNAGTRTLTLRGHLRVMHQFGVGGPWVT